MAMPHWLYFSCSSECGLPQDLLSWRKKKCFEGSIVVVFLRPIWSSLKEELYRKNIHFGSSFFYKEHTALLNNQHSLIVFAQSEQKITYFKYNHKTSVFKKLTAMNSHSFKIVKLSKGVQLTVFHKRFNDQLLKLIFKPTTCFIKNI